MIEEISERNLKKNQENKMFYLFSKYGPFHRIKKFSFGRNKKTPSKCETTGLIIWDLLTIKAW